MLIPGKLAIIYENFIYFNRFLDARPDCPYNGDGNTRDFMFSVGVEKLFRVKAFSAFSLS